MSIWVLTYEQIVKLKNECKIKEQELSDLQAKSVKDLWQTDLDYFLKVLEEVEEKEE